MPDFRIRSATETDCALILDLIRQLADFERLSQDVVATEQTLRESLFTTPAPAEIILAEVQSDGGTWKNAGFALYFTTYSTFLAKPGIYLEDLFVPPEHRSLGIGRKLLQHLAALAIKRGCGRLEWSVLDWNQRAWEFYARLGAKPMTEWTAHRLTGAALEDLAKSD